MTRTSIVLTVALVLMGACSKPEPTPTPAPAASSSAPSASASTRKFRFPPPRDLDADGFPKIEGLPDALTCTTDADCEVSPPPDASGCCALPNKTPMAKAYVGALAAWAKTQCGAFECPVMSVPGARPGPCAFVARCAAKKCTNACSADGGGQIRGTHGMSDTTAP